MATGVCAIAMGTGHPGAGPAGGGLREGRSEIAPGPAEGWEWGLGRRGVLGDPGRPSLMSAETLLRHVLFPGPLAAPARSAGRRVDGERHQVPPSRS